MKTKLLASLTAIATTATAAFSFSASAQAFSFGTDGFTFDQNTTIDFTFYDSHGSYQSDLGVYQVDKSGAPTLVQTLFHEIKGSDNDSTNEWQGTFGNSVAGGDATYDKSGNVVSYGLKTQEVTFLAGQLYTLGLTSSDNNVNVGTVFSSTTLNLNSDPNLLQSTDGQHTQQALFGPKDVLLKVLDVKRTTAVSNPGQYSSANPFADSVLVSFDDRGNNNDRDYQDYIVTAKTVPEPASLAGLGLVAGGMLFSSRRRRQIG